MANPEHLAILKQGVEEWNRWRKENPDIQPDLSWADFSGADLRGVTLIQAYLNHTNFYGANLHGVYLARAHLYRANLSEAVLSEAYLSGAYLSGVDLSRADLSEVHLNGTDLSGANLRGAYLGRADFRGAYLSGVDLSGADLSGATIEGTTFGDLDLSEVKGLDTVKHDGPSTIGIDTLYLSKGKIPEAFLRGGGLSDWEIEFARLYQEGLSTDEINTILYRVQELRAGQPLQISPLFISYSHADRDFVDVMEKHLDQRGIRFWRDVHHATAGRLEKQIDRAIRLNDTVLLVLSKNSVKSDWVQHEARLARKLEIETGRDVLCPVALDDSWKTCHWPDRLREQIMEYNILGFSEWEDAEAFERMFTKLVDGLDLFYGQREEVTHQVTVAVAGGQSQPLALRVPPGT